MSTVAQNLFDVLHAQIVDDTLAYAHQVLDKNHTGSFSIRQPIELPEFSEGVATYFGNNATVDTLTLKTNLNPCLNRFLKISRQEIQKQNVMSGTCPIWIRFARRIRTDFKCHRQCLRLY